MTNPEDYPKVKADPEKEFAALGVSFLMMAPKIKQLVDYAASDGPPSKQKLAAEIAEAMFKPIEVMDIPPDDEALKLAKQYEELIEQG